MPGRNDGGVDAPQHLGFLGVGLEVRNGVADALGVHGEHLAADAVHRVFRAERLVGGCQRHGEREAMQNRLKGLGGELSACSGGSEGFGLPGDGIRDPLRGASGGAVDALGAMLSGTHTFESSALRQISRNARRIHAKIGNYG